MLSFFEKVIWCCFFDKDTIGCFLSKTPSKLESAQFDRSGSIIVQQPNWWARKSETHLIMCLGIANTSLSARQVGMVVDVIETSIDLSTPLIPIVPTVRVLVFDDIPVLCCWQRIDSPFESTDPITSGVASLIRWWRIHPFHNICLFAAKWTSTS